MTGAVGERHRIHGAGYTAEVSDIGASLSGLWFGRRALVAGFGAGAVRPAMSGALLVPWPNRTAGGAFVFDGRRHRLELTEPSRDNAIHGLIAWQRFEVLQQSASTIRLRASILPQPGYPWRLRAEVAFGLDARGLTQQVEIVNEADATAPLGIGGHPYLLAGLGRPNAVNEWRLQLDAATVVLLSEDRMLPEDTVPVRPADGHDFSGGRLIGETVLNHAYTALRRDDHGVATVTVTDADGIGAAISWDERCPWVQVYTADDPGHLGPRSAVAVEPMTCPPDALNSSVDLIRVGPGDSSSVAWSISQRS